MSVYIENGIWGATIAVPIARVLMEQYLADTVTRPDLVQYIKNLQLSYPAYDRKQQ